MVPRQRLITTVKGRLGLATPFVMKGDRICAIEGCGSLVLLRPAGEYFEFVGLVHIDGLSLGQEVQQCQERGFDGRLKIR